MSIISCMYCSTPEYSQLPIIFIYYLIAFLYFRCKIYFYLEDDSIQVIEPKVENSGIPQGMFNLFIIYFQLITAQSLLRKNILTRRGASAWILYAGTGWIKLCMCVILIKNMVEVWSTFQLCRSIKYSSTPKLYHVLQIVLVFTNRNSDSPSSHSTPST